jgi:hypothetical protein
MGVHSGDHTEDSPILSHRENKGMSEIEEFHPDTKNWDFKHLLTSH